MWLVFAWACTAADVAPAPAPDVDEPSPEVLETLFASGVVATGDLPAGHVITARDVMVGSVPDFAPAPPTEVAALVGATVREPIYGGEPVRTERIVRPADGTSGFDALVGPGERAVSLSVPPFAATALDAGCPVEVLAADDASRRPRVLTGTHHRVLGVDVGADRAAVVVAAPVRGGRTGLEVDRATVVALPMSAVIPEQENQGPLVFEPPASRPGPPIAVASRTLLPGVMIRTDDLAEVGGAGLEGLRYAVAWAQVPIHPVYPGELPHPLRLAAPGRGLCTFVPNGLRAVAVPAAGPVSADLVDAYVRVRLGENQLDHLYVGSADPAGAVVVVFTLPEQARALAVAAATVGTRFEVTPSSPL